jgi:polysaccharide pyruvyl transferase CsaB
MGNAGDEAVLAALVQLFWEREPEIEIAVLSGDPAGTARDHGVAALPRMAPGAILSGLRQCDLFVSGGGSLLQDATSPRSLLYYLALILLARLARRPVAVVAQGIGPIRRPALRRLTGRILRGVARITVRDAESEEDLRRLGVGTAGRPEVTVTADPVFALRPAAADRGKALLGQLSGPRPWVGVSVRPWPSVEALLPSLGAALREVDRAGGSLLFLPLQPEADRPLCCRLAEYTGTGAVLEDAPSPSEWLALVSGLDLVVAMRLHALIFAAAAGKPCLGLSYDPKVDSLLARLDLTPSGRVPDFDPAPFTARLATALRDPHTEQPAPAVVDPLREAARRNAEIALSVVQASAHRPDQSPPSVE